jgi:hypothetical protein
MNGIEAMQSVTDRPRELVIRSRQDGTQQVLVSHLSGRHCELAVGLLTKTRNQAIDPHIERRIGDRSGCKFAIHQVLEGDRIKGIAAKQPVFAQNP